MNRNPSTETKRKKPKHKPLGKKIIEVEIDPALNKGKRPSQEQLEARQDQAYRLRLLGKTPEEISELFGVSARQIRTYLAQAKERQVNELRKLEGKAGVLRQFGVLNHILDESLQAYEKSKLPKKSKTAMAQKYGGEGKENVLTRTSQNEIESIGDIAYLDRALKASEQIRNLLGMDAPAVKRILVAEDPISKINENEFKELSTEELLARYRAAIGIGGELEK